MHPGQSLGKFTLESLIGTGGFGDVWKARDPSLGRTVALKLLRQDDPQNAARFLREAQAAAALAHPNIVRVYETGTIGDQPYIAMEFIDGPTLPSARGTPRDIAGWIRDAARALHYAHERGIIHRDVKPENLMLEGRRILVMDFGLARTVQASGLTAAGMAIGTPNFMAPEQARGDLRDIDARSDVYALGGSLYTLLAGRPPFQATTLLEILEMIVNDDPPPLRSLAPAVDRDLETIVHKCLEKEPSRRYGSAEALAADLDRFLAGDAIDARASTVFYRIGKSLRRRRGVALALGGGILAVAMVLLLLLPALRRTEGGLTAAQRHLVDQMRRASDVSLSAALDLRRAGNLGGMRAQGAELAAVCGRVTAELPRLAEPHVRLARIYRAQLRWNDALAAVDAALLADPADRDARFERGYLLYRAYIIHLDTLVAEWRRDEAAAMFRDRPRSDLPPRDRLEDARARALRRRVEQDFAGLDDPVALALTDWLSGGSAWRDRLAAVLHDRPDREETVDILGRIHVAAGALDEADALYRDAIERDRGYLPFYLGRARIAVLRAAADVDPVTHYRAAVEILDRAAEVAPEAPILYERGTARAAWALFVARDDGDTETLRRGAVEDLERTCALTPTLASPLVALAGILQLFATDALASGRDFAPYIEAAERRLAEARRLDDSSSVRGRLGYLLTVKAWLHHQVGHDAVAELDRALDLLDDASRESPDVVAHWNRRAVNRHYAAIVAESMGRDPLPALQAARESLDKAGRLEPADVLALSSRAGLESDVAAWAALRGRPFDEAFAAAVRLHDLAVEKGPDRAHPLGERARTLLRWADARLARGQELGDRLDRAEADLDKAVRIAPLASFNWSNRGQVHAQRALSGVFSGRDPTDGLRRAIADFDHALVISPKDDETFVFRAGARANLGYWTFLRGGDPTPHYRAAMADYDAALAINARRDETWLRRGQLFVNSGLYLRSTGQDPEPLYARAAADYERARSIHASREETFLSEAQLGINWGGLRASRNADPSEPYARALSAVDRAIAINPASDHHHLKRGQLHVSRAIWTQRTGDPTPDLEEAVREYGEALKLNDRRDETWLSRAHARAILFSRGDRLSDEREREILDDFAKAASINPSNAEARWRRAQFHMSRSRWRQALDDFDAAKKINPSIESRFAQAIDECRRRLGE
jgi:tetratricopeptide (TPR) repeat protein/tRNA A-37 threonylcarbamoyl transferase component Bud32